MSIFLLLWRVAWLGKDALGYLVIGGIPRVLRYIDEILRPELAMYHADRKRTYARWVRPWLAAYYWKCGGRDRCLTPEELRRAISPQPPE